MQMITETQLGSPPLLLVVVCDDATEHKPEPAGREDPVQLSAGMDKKTGCAKEV
ncbi:hypothetical protein SAMN05661003_1142 [Desulfuromonas thiophila]|uniref:Uncharacterized protein n=1 Tax=Desulfuromonas thiophila TaxID=57664 RepID=A0A1G7DJD4_9BACT|nr:hypothetical protein SAMN05661003_1142 [Desulfuromonas thiophila]